MKRLFYWIFFLFILSCSKKDPCDGVEEIQITGYKNLDESQKQLMPYQGSETLLFISNKGDTALLKGTGSLQEYRRLKLSGSGYYCGEEHYDSYQFLAAEYKGDNPKFNQLKVELFRGYANEPAFNFYFNGNNPFYRSLWDGHTVEALNYPKFSPFMFFFKGDSVLTTKLEFYNGKENYDPYLLYLPQKGIIAINVDSMDLYILE